MKKRLVAAMFAVMMISLVGCGKASEPMPIEATEAVEESETVEETETEEVTEVSEPTETEEVSETAEEPVAEEPASPYSYTELSQTMYAQSTVNVRDLPEQSGAKLGSLSTNQEVTVTGQCNETGWYRISYNGGEAYVSDSYLGTEKVVVKSQNTSGSSKSTSQAESQPAQEAPAAEPEVQPGQVDTSNAPTVDRQLEYGETLAPDHYLCPICGFETDDAEAAHAHLVEVHNMQV